MSVDIKFNVSSLILTCISIGLGVALFEKDKEIKTLKKTIGTLKLSKGDNVM